MNSLPIHSFLFNSAEFKVYGTHENPLFLVNDVVCNLLEMKKVGDNQFFKDHKADERYVLRGEIPSSSPELQERFKKSNKNYVYFFTEKGLYKCLMRSNKPVAELFQDEICDLLKNIRLEVVSITVNRV